MSTPTKRCKTCQRELPLNSFYIHKRMADGHLNICIECVSIARKLKRSKDPEAAKQKDNERYKRDRERIRSRAKTYYAKDPQKVKDRFTKWRKANPEKRKAQVRRYGTSHREQRRAYYKRHYATNPAALEQLREKRKQFKQNNPDYLRVSASIRRARKRNLPDAFRVEDWQYALEYWHHCCAYCGNQQGLFSGMDLTMDHFIPIASKSEDNPGHVPENIIPACRPCNTTKNKRDPNEFLETEFGKRKAKKIRLQIEAFFEHLRSRKL